MSCVGIVTVTVNLRNYYLGFLTILPLTQFFLLRLDRKNIWQYIDLKFHTIIKVIKLEISSCYRSSRAPCPICPFPQTPMPPPANHFRPPPSLNSTVHARKDCSIFQNPKSKRRKKKGAGESSFYSQQDFMFAGCLYSAAH